MVFSSLTDQEIVQMAHEDWASVSWRMSACIHSISFIHCASTFHFSQVLHFFWTQNWYQCFFLKENFNRDISSHEILRVFFRVDIKTLFFQPWASRKLLPRLSIISFSKIREKNKKKLGQPKVTQEKPTNITRPTYKHVRTRSLNGRFRHSKGFTYWIKEIKQQIG